MDKSRIKDVGSGSGSGESIYVGLEGKWLMHFMEV